MVIYTIGHSTRSINDFLDILRHYKINFIADVRRWPKSSHNPQYNKENLEKVLKKVDIEYIWLGEELGGYRSLKDIEAVKHKRGKCLKSGGFKNYVAYMNTKSFKKGLKTLLELSRKANIAIMCAEILYWKCHRSIISDKLKSIGQEVVHIIDKEHFYPHEYTKCARIERGKLIYSF